MTKTITAVFGSRSEADDALQKLEIAGFTPDQVSLLVSEEAHGHYFGFAEDDKSDEGAVAGATMGGLAGALYLGLASAGTFFIPGLNLFVSGALLGSLAGLGAGATVGGLVGALVGSTVPEHEVKVYEDRLRAGGILMTIDAYDNKQEEMVKDILKSANAQTIKSLAA